jgi:hypothetical protein
MTYSLHTRSNYDSFPTIYTLILIAIAFHLFDSIPIYTSCRYLSIKMNSKTITVIGARLGSYTQRLTVFGPGISLQGGRKPRFEVEESTEWPKVWNLGMIEDLRKRRN